MYKYCVAGVLAASVVPWACWLQVRLWMCAVETVGTWGLILSFYYFPALGALTCWYWAWRGIRRLGYDEGPLPRFMVLLIILWLPCTLLPAVMLLLTALLFAAAAKLG